CCKNPVAEPIDPSSGAMYSAAVDFREPQSPLQFARYYNSLDESTTHLSPGWRHTFTRRISPRYSTVDYLPYVSGDPDNSSLYSDPASACVNGFLQIRGRVTNWASATATYVGTTCSVSVGG